MHTIYWCYYVEVGIESYPAVASVVLKYSKFGQIQVEKQQKKKRATASKHQKCHKKEKSDQHGARTRNLLISQTHYQLC